MKLGEKNTYLFDLSFITLLVVNCSLDEGDTDHQNVLFSFVCFFSKLFLLMISFAAPPFCPSFFFCLV